MLEFSFTGLTVRTVRPLRQPVKNKPNPVDWERKWALRGQLSYPLGKKIFYFTSSILVTTPVLSSTLYTPSGNLSPFGNENQSYLCAKI